MPKLALLPFLSTGLLPSLLLGIGTFLAGCLSTNVTAQQPVDYTTEIRPILLDKCFTCHGPDHKKREGGLRYDREAVAKGPLPSGKHAIVPGDPSASELVRRIFSEDPDERMPPPKSGLSLSSDERNRLKRWIAEGAAWEEHWSFRTALRPQVPEAQTKEWPRNPIDHFVLRQLEGQEMQPSDTATRAQLLRRVSYDLTGLPPSLEELDAFLADQEEGAYERCVDRLLDSPQYAEHQARQWLDLARFGDTHGLHLDNVRSLWPYRDWVIDAFRSNMPFDQFTVEQLAGDLLPEATASQKIATGFNRCNVTTGEGGLIVEEYLVNYAVDRVLTTSTVWLGLTASCAQCHSHKYDPFTQKEFYQLFAFFNNVDEEGTDRNALTPKPMMKAPTAEQGQRLKELSEATDVLEKQLDTPLPEVDQAQAKWESQWTSQLTDSWHTCTPLSAISRGGSTLTVQTDGSVRASGTDPARDIYEIVVRTDLQSIKALRIEALIDKEHGGVGRSSHHNVVLTDLSVKAAATATPLKTVAVKLGAASASFNQRDFPIRKALDDDPSSGWANDKGDRDRSLVFAIDQALPNQGGTIITLRLAFESKFSNHNIGRLRVSASSKQSLRPSTLGPWHALGAFQATSFKLAFDTDYGCESAVDLGAKIAGQAWKPRPDLVDEKVHSLKGGNSAFYFTRTIEADGPRPMSLMFGSDDAIKVWLNNELVHSKFKNRPVAPDQDKVTVQLRKGSNQLLLKITNGGGQGGFYFRVQGEDTSGLPTDLIAALTSEGARDKKTESSLRTYFRRHHSPAWKALETKYRAAKKQQLAYDAALPRTMIMKERSKVRKAHLLIRGSYDRKAEEVTRGVPSFLPPLPHDDRPIDRLTLARWLVEPNHPLTARVTVNRMWQSLFGIGLVKTTEDFGARGERPSHPELFDWLAREFVDSGWDVKHTLRLMVTSSTYRQSSRAPREAFASDPDNRELSRGSRFRLDAEAIRDTALSLGGLLVPTVGGPSVKPYQPIGIWKAVGYTSSNTANFVKDAGDALYRRSMYTFWKRTAPPPTMQIFDAPSREYCTVKRARTNTPLQALAMQNDIQFVEAARAFAQRILQTAGTDDRQRLSYAFRLATARVPDPSELKLLEGILKAQLEDFRAAPESAQALISTGDSKLDTTLDPITFAAWTTIASMILNLDETITKS